MHKKVLFPVLIFTFLILFLYLPTLRWLVDIWSKDEQFVHGFIVPFISLYLVWLKRDHLNKVPIKPSLVGGGLIVLFAMVLLLLGRCGAFVHAEGASLFFILPGMVLFLFGPAMLKFTIFPICYIQFMLPWLDPIFEKIQPYFQYITAIIGAHLLSLKYPVFLDGIDIHLPQITLVVARECSGINFLVSILAIGLPLVYLCQKTWTRAIFILVVSCLLSIFSNGIRVALAGVMGKEFGTGMLHGPAHILEGWFVAWVGWISIFVANWLVAKIPHKNGFTDCYLYQRIPVEENADISSHNYSAFKLNFSTISIVLSVFGIYLNFFSLPKDVALESPLMQFPTEISNWQGEQNDWFEAAKYFPKLDDSLSMIFRDNSGNVVNLFIGYYQKQDNEKRLVSYLSKPLTNSTNIMNISSDSSFQVIASPLISGSSHFDTLFWYQFPNKFTMIDNLRVKLYVIKSSILQGHNNGAFILLAIPKNEDEDEGKMESFLTLKTFITDFKPVLDNFLPSSL